MRDKRKEKRDGGRFTFPGRVLLYALLIALFAWILFSFLRSSNAAGTENLRKAIDQDITSFYAENGRYPSSVEELKKTYRLNYDDDRYFVGYELRGANIRPYVTVVRKGR